MLQHFNKNSDLLAENLEAYYDDNMQYDINIQFDSKYVGLC